MNTGRVWIQVGVAFLLWWWWAVANFAPRVTCFGSMTAQHDNNTELLFLERDGFEWRMSVWVHFFSKDLILLFCCWTISLVEPASASSRQAHFVTRTDAGEGLSFHPFDLIFGFGRPRIFQEFLRFAAHQQYLSTRCLQRSFSFISSLFHKHTTLDGSTIEK